MFWLFFLLILNLWTLWVIQIVFKQDDKILSNKELLQKEDEQRRSNESL
jgi:hypothetical protein